MLASARPAFKGRLCPKCRIPTFLLYFIDVYSVQIRIIAYENSPTDGKKKVSKH